MADHEISFTSASDAAHLFESDIAKLLQSVRGIQLGAPEESKNIRETLAALGTQLRRASKANEAEALEHAGEKAFDKPAFGGLGLIPDGIPTYAQYQDLVSTCEAWLESLNSREASQNFLSVKASPSPGTRPMTLAQKIFAQHVIGGMPVEGLKAGDVVRVGVDWVLASELSWMHMARTYESIGSPSIWRNDRFWLAGDHAVHPTIYDNPKIRAYIETAEKAKKNFKMTDYQGMNYTIMHTEFVRERAEPGMMCLGSDSHSCSAGAVGCLSIGLGTADVMMALALGETWFKVPDSILIEFTGKPDFAISGKDVILYILQQLKRNSVAGERVVEFAGEGLQYLSVDARFAIANMCTEFGAVTGVFVPDAITKDYISKRRRKANRVNSLFFKPDANAEYVGRFTIDLSKVEPSIAVYPKPDHVVPVSEMANLQLDGVFIGACTTTEEELVLAALVLKVGLEKKIPLAKGKKHYVAGSLPIVEKLRELGILAIYEAAGFTRGPPGCSYCVGLTAEKASEGETWLSSQNRNFENRMGKGAFGHITSAAVCAASAFSMTPTNPADFIKDLDQEFWAKYKTQTATKSGAVTYTEPDLSLAAARDKPAPKSELAHGAPAPEKSRLMQISSRVTRLPDFVDTDALAPGETLTTCVTDEQFGQHVLKYTHPEFRQKVKNGQQVVVAGNAFGVGSSREVAVSALKGAGVQAVIARSFAFIYGRNQPSLGLLGITVEEDAFYEHAQENAEITIDIPSRKLTVAGREFDFQLSDMEYNLLLNQGVAQSYNRYGKAIWANMTSSEPEPLLQVKEVSESKPANNQLNW